MSQPSGNVMRRSGLDKSYKVCKLLSSPLINLTLSGFYKNNHWSILWSQRSRWDKVMFVTVIGGGVWHVRCHSLWHGHIQTRHNHFDTLRGGPVVPQHHLLPHHFRNQTLSLLQTGKTSVAKSLNLLFTGKIFQRRQK